MDDAFDGDMQVVESVAEFEECLRPTLLLLMLLWELLPLIRWTGVTLEAYMVK